MSCSPSNISKEKALHSCSKPWDFWLPKQRHRRGQLEAQQPRGGRDVAVTMKYDYFHHRDRAGAGMLGQGLETGWRTRCSGISRGHVQSAQLNLPSESHQSDAS